VERGVAGVKMGRPAMGNPAIFDHMKNELGVNDPPMPVPTSEELKREYDSIYEAIGSSEKYRSRFLKVMEKDRPRY
jgi:tRNA-dihydrouridine synthase